MQSFERGKFRASLRAYVLPAYLLGWILVVSGVLTILQYVPEPSEGPAAQVYRQGVNGWLYPMLNLVFPGVFAWIAARLMRHAANNEARRGWLLEYGHVLMLASLPLQALRFVIILSQSGQFLNSNLSGDFAVARIFSFLAVLLMLLEPLLIVTAQCLLALGLAFALRRMLPMIEESKALA